MTGIESRRGSRGVVETTAAIRAEIEARGATVVAVVDHAAAARAVGLDLPDTQVIIFGNPKAGTPLMQIAPEIALDLPLRVLVRDDRSGGAIVSWQDPDFVAERFGLDGAHRGPLAAIEAIVEAGLHREVQ